MGNELVIKGYKPYDNRYRKMEAVYYACEAAQISIPANVSAFFNYAPPGAATNIGVEVDGTPGKLSGISSYAMEGTDVVKVELGLLPKELTVLCFYYPSKAKEGV